MEKVPEMLLELVDEMCQCLDRHEQQATSFHTAVAQGRGFGPSPIFPPDIVPPVNRAVGLSRCMEPTFDKTTLPPQELSLHMPLFKIPIPRPGLACGFSQISFSPQEFKALPPWLTAVGTYSDYGTGEIQPGQAVHVPFLMFERTYGHARHEIEAAINYCAMDGAAALQGLLTLYDKAWEQDDWNRPASPVVFTCTIDDCLAIIHHHWIDDHKTFMAAPLCKFDLRDNEHFMHFLAWTESIEQWASYFLLPDVKEALGIIEGFGTIRSLSSPVTIEEKKEKLQQSMKLAFDNIPWRVQKLQGTPLAVTATMRSTSPPPLDDEIVIFESSVEESLETDSVDGHVGETPTQPLSAHNAGDRYPPSPVPSSRSEGNGCTDSFRYTQLPSPYTAGITLESARARDPKRVHAKMLPPPRPDEVMGIITPAMSSPTCSTSTLSVTSTKEKLPRATYNANSNDTRCNTLTEINASLYVSLATHAVPPQVPAPLSLSQSLSKRSLPSLRQHKRIRSPGTPETLGNSSSPKSTGFRSKISSSLIMIKEHARPKRVRTDNSGPSTPKHGDTLPTPAYDKRTFEAPDTDADPSQTTAWVEHVLQDRIIMTNSIPKQPSRNSTPVNSLPKSNEISSPLRSNAVSPPPRHPTPLNGAASPPSRKNTPLSFAAEPLPQHKAPFSVPSRNHTPVNAVVSPPPRSQTVSPSQRNKTPLYTAEPPPRNGTPMNAPSRNRTPVNVVVSAPAQNKSPSHAVIPPSRGHTPVHKLGLVTMVQPILDQVPSAGTSNYLPLRDYSASEPLKAQTITTSTVA